MLCTQIRSKLSGLRKRTKRFATKEELSLCCSIGCISNPGIPVTTRILIVTWTCCDRHLAVQASSWIINLGLVFSYPYVFGSSSKWRLFRMMIIKDCFINNFHFPVKLFNFKNHGAVCIIFFVRAYLIYHYQKIPPKWGEKELPDRLYHRKSIGVS